MRSRWDVHLAGSIALLIAATCVAYLPAMHGQFIWDDEAHVTKPALQSLAGLSRIWLEVFRVDQSGELLRGATQQYYPLLHSAFWLEYQLWGDNPLGYHLANVLEHALAACLVLLILRKLSVPGALVAAGIFALHPVQVESVAWITEQKNTLSAVFYLSAMLVYLHFDQGRKPALYGAALALFVMGLLSKTVTATLPAALLVVFWWQRGSLSWKRDVLPLVPFFLMGAAAGLFTAWVEHDLIGAKGASFDLTIVDRCLLAGRVIWFYLGNLLWPSNLIFFYPRWIVDPAIWWQWLFPLAAVAALAALFLLRSRWRAPLAGALFFVGTLFPVLGFFNVFPFFYSFVADHFQYLASLGIIVLAGAAFALATAHLRQQARWIGYGACLLLLATLGTLTWRQSSMYGDISTLYRTTLARNPGCWLVWNNLGKMCYEQGKLPESEEYYRHSLALKPDYHLAHFNLGVTLKAEGRFPEAIEQFQQAIRAKPAFPDAYFTWGVALVAQGQLQEAVEKYEQALQLKPNYAEVHSNLAFALLQLGRTQNAIDHLQKAIQLRPDLAQLHVNLGIVLARLGRLQDAIDHYQRAIKLQPKYTEACLDMAVALADANRIDEAISAAVDALNLAQSQGQTQLAQQIEALLRALRGNQ